MTMETTYKAHRPFVLTATAEELQARREAIWESAVGREAAQLLALQMRRGASYSHAA